MSFVHVNVCKYVDTVTICGTCQLCPSFDLSRSRYSRSASDPRWDKLHREELLSHPWGSALTAEPPGCLSRHDALFNKENHYKGLGYLLCPPEQRKPVWNYINDSHQNKPKCAQVGSIKREYLARSEPIMPLIANGKYSCSCVSKIYTYIYMYWHNI